MSRIGEEGGWEELECWGKASFSSALVVAARIVHLGAPVFDNEVSPLKELEDTVTIDRNHDERSDNLPICRGSMSFLPRRIIVFQEDFRCYRSIRCCQTQRRVSDKRSVDAEIGSLDINVCGLHGLGATG